jgi:hypothetical protein
VRARSATGSAGTNGSVAGKAASTVANELGAVASPPDLVLALETLATRSHYDDVDPNEQRRKIGYLQDQFGARWGDRGEVAEAFANAWAEADDRRSAIIWYRRAVNAGDGTASMRATEQLANLRARVALEMAEKFSRRLDRLRARTPRATARELAKAQETLDAVITKARSETDAARALLEPIAAERPSLERLSLCGSAWKRRAMIERIAGDSSAEDRATSRMKVWYERAEQLASERRDPLLYYPALNRMAAELVVDAKKRTWGGFDRDALAAVRENLDTKTRDDPDFWSVAGRTELKLYEALAREALVVDGGAIKAEYDDLWARVRAFGDWDSVNVQLRFVLPKYVERTSAAERAAATDLMGHVRRLAARAKRAATRPA